MQNDWTPLVCLIWLAGTWLRLRQQAHFYQIEEYMSGRYLRWLLSARERCLPLRQIFAALLGVALTSLVGHPHDSLAGSCFALAAVFPKPQRKSKKPLVMTVRVKRILAVAHILCALPIAGVWAAGAQIPVIIGAGLAVWLLAPLWAGDVQLAVDAAGCFAAAAISASGGQCARRRPSPRSSASPAVMARRPPSLFCATSSASAIRYMPRPKVTTR